MPTCPLEGPPWIPSPGSLPLAALWCWSALLPICSVRRWRAPRHRVKMKPLEDDKMNGAKSLVKTLLAAGVDTCFANPGTSEMHFVAALDQVPGMKCVLGLQ